MIQQPALPASPATISNTAGQSAQVTIIGGTVTSVNVPSGGTQVAAATNFTATVPAGSSIGITYSVAPTSIYWSTLTPAVPASGTAVANTTGQDITVILAAGTTTHITVNGTDRGTTTPAQVMLPAGQSITLTYSVAPVWSWQNFIDLVESDSLGVAYAQANTVTPSGGTGYSPLNALPYAVHAEGGLTGLAAAVSNLCVWAWMKWLLRRVVSPPPQAARAA